MANSSAVSSGDLATADQYNNLRDDVLSTCSGHLHDGTNGRGDGAFSLEVSGVPLTIENSTDGTSNQVMLLRGDNATRADGDEIYMSFNLDDDGGNSHEFARITAEAVDVSNGSEDGQLRFGVSVAGTMTDVFQINSSTAGATSISYEVDAFTIKGEEGGAGVLYLFADQGDDAGDEWKINIADGGVMTFGNDIASAGSYVTHMTLTPNSTVACSTVAFAGNVTVASDLTVSGGCITLACSKIFSGGDTTSLNLIDALDATTEATIEGAIDTLSNLGTIGKACATTNIVAGDITMYNAVNNGNPTISLGSASAERLIITANYDSGAQTLCNVEFATAAASGTANKGKFVFDVDGTDIVTIDDGGIDIASGKTFSINGSDISTTDTTYTAGDGLTLTGTEFDLDAALTTVTSMYNASLKVGRDSGNLIDFATTDNKLIFRVECVNEVELVQNALSPVTSDGVALGTSSLMWSDAFLASGSVINFNNGDITLTHSACTLTMAGGTLATGAISTTGSLTVGVCGTGHDVKFFGCLAGAYMLYDQSEEQLEIRGSSANAATSTGKLLLTTGQTAVDACDVIGSINFQAPAEAGGTDAVAIAAGIRAVAQATFTCAVNATDLIFYTGHSEAATEKFRFTSQGEIGIGGANYGNCGQVLTSGGAGAAPSWACVSGGGVVSGGTDNAILRADGTGGSTSQGSAVTIADTTGDITLPAAGQILTGTGGACNPGLSFRGDCNTGFFRPSSDKLAVSIAAYERMRWDGSTTYILDTANGDMAAGLTIGQEDNDNALLAFKSDDVAHGQTAAYETDTFGLFKKLSAASGGMRQVALAEAAYKTAWAVEARVGTACTGNTACSQAAMAFMAIKKCGSGGAGFGTCDNIASFHTSNSESGYGVLLVKGNGDIHSATGSVTNEWDAYCDVALLTAARAIQHDEGTDFRNRYAQWIDDYGCILEETKVISRNLDTGGPAFVSHNGMMGLTVDAIRQLGERIVTLETQLQALSEGK